MSTNENVNEDQNTDEVKSPLCDTCGKPGEDMWREPNPYRRSMFGDETLEWIHKECYNDAVLSV